MDMSQEKVNIPLLDVNAPQEIKTATFALG